MSLKYQILAEELRKKILSEGPEGEKKLPSEAALSEAYGFSRQTVRKALSCLLDEGLIETRKGSGTYISALAFPSAAKSREIALLSCSSTDTAELLEAQTLLSSAGYTTTLYHTEHRTQKEREILLKLQKKPVRGLLIEGVRTAFPNVNLPIYKGLFHAGTALVFVRDSYPGFEEATRIETDRFPAARKLTEALLAKGHQNIAGILRLDSRASHRCYAGVLDALCNASLPFDDRHFLWVDPLSERPTDPKLLRSFLRIVASECTAILCESEQVAVAAGGVLRGMGLSERVEVAVIENEEGLWMRGAKALLAQLA